MEWDILVGPVIGAVIGYVTNKIAVEMLFHPLNPIYIGKIHIPFTPGIIPKGKERLGKAIGDTVGNNLLTPAALKDTLLSPEIEHDIECQIDLMFKNLSVDDTTINSKMELILGEAVSEHLEVKLVQVVSDKVSSGLKSVNLGELVSTEVKTAIQEKVQGTMLAMLVKPSTIAPIADEIEVRVNQYMTEHAEDVTHNFIQNEFSNLKEQTISSILENIDTTEIKKAILKIYREIITSYAEKFLSALDLSKIVEDKVSAMSTKEVEKLVLAIMEKELGAVVNLGAVIGFILGLFNLLNK